MYTVQGHSVHAPLFFIVCIKWFSTFFGPWLYLYFSSIESLCCFRHGQSEHPTCTSFWDWYLWHCTCLVYIYIIMGTLNDLLWNTEYYFCSNVMTYNAGLHCPLVIKVFLTVSYNCWHRFPQNCAQFMTQNAKSFKLPWRRLNSKYWPHSVST